MNAHTYRSPGALGIGMPGHSQHLLGSFNRNAGVILSNNTGDVEARYFIPD